MTEKYEQLMGLVENCGDDVLYGALVGMQNFNPNWRSDPELRKVALKIGAQLTSHGWAVELGLPEQRRKFWVCPPEGSSAPTPLDYTPPTNPYSSGVVKVGDYYISDRRRKPG